MQVQIQQVGVGQAPILYFWHLPRWQCCPITTLCSNKNSRAMVHHSACTQRLSETPTPRSPPTAIKSKSLWMATKYQYFFLNSQATPMCCYGLEPLMGNLGFREEITLLKESAGNSEGSRCPTILPGLWSPRRENQILVKTFQKTM